MVCCENLNRKELNIMKLSEMMLNYATGDACRQDAYIQQAMGQVTVSKSIFEAAVNIISMDPDEIQYVQEAVEEAGLSTDRNESLEIVQEAFKRSATGMLNLVQRTADKLAESANNSWMTVCGAAKVTGVPNDALDEGLETFAEQAATAIANKAYNDGVELSHGFKDGTSLRTAAGVYMKSIQEMLPAFGIKGDKGSNIIREYVALGDCDYTDGDLNKFIVALECASAPMKTFIAPADGATERDVEDYITTAATLKAFCEGVAEALNDESLVNTAAAYASENAGNGMRSQVAMEQMVGTANKIVAATNALHKALNDSGYAVGESINGGVAPLPTKKGEE